MFIAVMEPKVFLTRGRKCNIYLVFTTVFVIELYLFSRDVVFGFFCFSVQAKFNLYTFNTVS